MILMPSVTKANAYCVNGKDFIWMSMVFYVEKQQTIQLVLPERYKSTVLKELHEDMGQ